ncbi:PREDICTED: classical arabinogalactan protein 9-like [Nicotiana attenuata]|uniref:classical arabinogalactan protein 9-like n=1 Tax=Nicotiana attenuata TaxID=49451 RepID=UPI0009059C42|nr:PREDICTED: classical arabinogalactan protein 9-like [Nicotiana attenuata]
MAEMYQAWMKGHPPPSYPANPTSVPPLAQEPPVIDLSPQHTPSFNLYHHYTGSSSQTVQAPLAKSTACPPPPATPVLVAPPPATLHRSSSEPALQAQDNQYYTPEPTFKIPDHYSYTPRFDLPVETEKLPKNLE